MSALVLGILAASHALAADAAPPAATGRWSLPSIGNAATPPMGWNSWNAFGTDVDEGKVIGAAEAIVRSGLVARGYRYVNIDDGWWLKRRVADGRMIVRTSIFPSAATGGPDSTSFRPFTDRLHAIGLKAGIYSDIGYNACSQAWSPDNPNLPEGTMAEREVGLHGHVGQDLALYFGDWGFDYIKVDACGLSAFGATGGGGRQGRYRRWAPLIVDHKINRTDVAAVRGLYAEVRDALRQVRPAGDFVLSLCNWGSANVRSWGKDVGSLWRTSNDIAPDWTHMLHSFDSVSTRELYAGPGHWNDPDMLEVGNGDFDDQHLLQARAHFSLWAIEASPLMIGHDLRKASQAVIDVLGNAEVIAVNQDRAGNQGVLAHTGADYQIIVKTLATRGEKAVALFNRTDAPAEIELNAAHLKMVADRPIAMRDLWAHQDLGSFTGAHRLKLLPHEVVMLKVVGTPLLAKGAYLSEMTGRINVAEDGIPALEADPTIHRMADPYAPSTSSTGSRPVYAGWGGPRADSTPYDETLEIAGVAYRSGIGALANSRLEIRNDRQFGQFSAEVGIDDSTRGKRAAVRFEVYGDGRLLAKSRPVRFGQPAVRIAARVGSVKVVEIIARQLGPAEGNVVVTWGDAALR
ncbi:MAG: NPCBM/NEW2 domain-containing protein [Sphingomonadales bacterium]|nr:NPCBM/NEW2 domain-containing protein [Sphingomonadales bacterium]